MGTTLGDSKAVGGLACRIFYVAQRHLSLMRCDRGESDAQCICPLGVASARQAI